MESHPRNTACKAKIPGTSVKMVVLIADKIHHRSLENQFSGQNLFDSVRNLSLK